jgi:hypothetical protein
MPIVPVYTLAGGVRVPLTVVLDPSIVHYEARTGLKLSEPVKWGQKHSFDDVKFHAGQLAPDGKRIAYHFETQPTQIPITTLLASRRIFGLS